MASHPRGDPPLDWKEAVRQFGTPTDAFRPGLENIIAGLIIGGLLVVGGGAGVIALTQLAISRGAALPWFHSKDPSWVTVFGLGALGLLAIGGGIWLIVYTRRLFSLRLLVCPNGLVEVQRDEILCCRWEDIAEVEETILQEHFPLKGGLKYVAPVGKSRSYIVRGHDGKELIFDGNRVKGLGRLAKRLRQESESRCIPWKVKEESD